MLCNAISVDSLSEEQAAELMNSLRQQMMRLPDQDQLKTCIKPSSIVNLPKNSSRGELMSADSTISNIDANYLPLDSD